MEMVYTMVPKHRGLTRRPDFPSSTYSSRAVKVWSMAELSIVFFIFLVVEKNWGVTGGKRRRRECVSV
jgi:hypothetical protein